MFSTEDRKKALVILEPKREFGIGLISMANRLRHTLEACMWTLPGIDRICREYRLDMINGDISEEYLRERGIAVIDGYVPDEGPEAAIKEAISLGRGWHSYGELPVLLRISGINVGEAIQQMTMELFFLLFRKIDTAEAVLKRAAHDRVYVQSDFLTFERAFYVCARPKAKCTFLEPGLYRGIKKLIRSYLKYRSFVSVIDRSFGAYSVPGTQSYASGNCVLADMPYINDVNAIQPVIRELAHRGIYGCAVYGNGAMLAKRFDGMRPIRISKASYGVAKCEELRKYYRSKLRDDPDFQAIFTYRGINFWDAIHDEFDLLFEQEFRIIADDLVHFDEILRTVRPALLIVGDDRATRVRGHVLLAKQRGIPVLEVPHGLYNPSAPMDTPLSDRLAAGGDYSRAVFMKFGAVEGQTVVTGWPKFDEYAKMGANGEKRGTKDILFATQPVDVRLNLDIIEALGRFVNGYPHLRLIVKPHPMEKAETYYPIAGKYNNILVRKSTENISRLIASSDILVNRFSTVAVEAALLDKPVICINAAGDESLFAASGIAIEVHTPEGLIPALEDLLSNDGLRENLARARKRFVYEHAYLQDGNASKRVVDLIVSMVEASKKPELSPAEPGVSPGRRAQ